MLGERRALLLAESYDAEARATISQSDAGESSVDGDTEMVNPLVSGDEPDGEQEETSGRTEAQEASTADGSGSGGEPELLAIHGEHDERDENSMEECLGEKSGVESGEETREELELRSVANEYEAHAELVSGTTPVRGSDAKLQTAEATNSKIPVDNGCIHAEDAVCQESRVGDEGSDQRTEGKESNDLQINENEGEERGDAMAREHLEVAAEPKEKEPLPPPEYESVSIPVHWQPKPCLQIAGLGGLVSEEELISLITQHAPVSSIVFENEKRDAVIVRLQVSPGEEDKSVSAVREALNNVHFKEKTLVVDSFRPDSLLFIGNLTPEIDDELLKKMFGPHGTIERAFVLRNEEGRSKGYGFVEYSLKSQASTAKQIMGNINMDGRVLRVEWSDCKKVAEMFSTVLFVDRIAKECPNIENVLKTLFGEYGKVRDCHLAIGMSQQFRGFAIIDFNHSTYADKGLSDILTHCIHSPLESAHEALDGKEVESSNIRVSFANPSKSAQSYKSRFGSQGALGALAARGFPGVMPAMMGAALRSHMAIPFLAPRFLGARPGMLGMGIGMQFGRGAPVGPGMIGRGLVGPLLGAGPGMLGSGCIAGMMGRSPGLLLGPVPISPAAIAQVATAQAKVREEEAKARVEFRRLQQAAQQAQTSQQPGQNFYQQQQIQPGMGQEGQFSYQQAYQQTGQQPSTPQLTQHHQSYPSPYCLQSGQQQYIHQQQPLQPQLQAAYYQQQPQSNGQNPSAAHQQYNQYSQQCSQQEDQQQTQQYSLQQYGQLYNQTTAQTPSQQYTHQYQQTSSQQLYSQPEYAEYYAQQQQQEATSVQTVAAAGVITQAHEVAHQQYSAYYQQQAASVAGDQTVEAQWAAYYAAAQAAHQNGMANGSDQQGIFSQQQSYNGSTATAAYYQQAATAVVGHKRLADQMEYTSQTQRNAFSYHQQPQQPASSMGTYQHQATVTDPIYQQQASSNLTNYQQAATLVGYQQSNSTGYTASHQQPATSTVPAYQQLASSSYYQQPVGTYQQPSQAATVSASASDFSKRLRY